MGLIVNEMDRLYFEIAKKMEKLGIDRGGIRLTSLKGDPVSGISLILVASSYDDIKDSVTAYRSLHGVPLNYRSRGKSLEISSGSLSVLCDFAKSISFTPDDADDVIDFCAGLEGYYPGLSFEEIRMDKDSLSLLVSCALEEGSSAGDLYQALMPALNRFEMGVIKPVQR